MTALYTEPHHVIDNHIWQEFGVRNRKRVRNIQSRIAYDIGENLAYADEAMLYIGTDSQSIKYGRRAYGSSVCILGRNSEKNSNKALYTKRFQQDSLSMKDRLIHELEFSIQLREGLLASSVSEVLIEKGTRCTIDIDINPEPETGSNRAYANALYKTESLLEWTNENYPGVSLDVRFKPHAVFATKIGDRVCRGGF